MSFPIFYSPVSVSSAPGQVFNAAQCRPGDILLARIIAIHPSGLTWLKVGGVKGIIQPTLGARIGDSVRLEVTRHHQAPDMATSRTARSAGPDAGDSKSLFELVMRQNGRIVRLSVVIKTGTAASNTNAKPSPILQAFSSVPHHNIATMAHIAADMPTVRQVSAWLANLRHKRFPLKTFKGNQNRFGHRHALQESSPFHRSGEGQAPPLVTPGEQQPDADGDTGWAAFYLDDGPVRFRFRRRGAQVGGGQTEPELQASLLLFHEGIGALRTDLRMAVDTLAVTIYVENNDCRRPLAAALPELEAALAPLVAQCCLHVVVSPNKIDALWREAVVPAGPAPVDVRI